MAFLKNYVFYLSLPDKEIFHLYIPLRKIKETLVKQIYFFFLPDKCIT